MATDGQPLSKLVWLRRDTIQPNDYNPNHQPPPEHRLLKVSLMEDGWTQPIVVFDAEDGSKPIIVDGEHRWRASADPEIQKLTKGLIPVVRIVGEKNHLMMSTIRHNRARGEHGVLPMCNIVGKLLASGKSKEEVMQLLQMEQEEVNRLAENSEYAEYATEGVGGFEKGWVPEDRD